ncbi:hypothetical protein [Streptomyces sulphureus]|uniref:hypothetical protein n=1 Tax=Streptomyces sulphureus TaxID=47758 RepID=UPI001FE17BA9|nr:hypothetical protein [Streptomyces sulphureus]
MIRSRQGELLAEVTDAGKFYLKHGHHPDDPAHAEQKPTASTAGTSRAPDAGASDTRPTTTKRGPRSTKKAATKPTPYSERPIPLARRAKATQLIEQLATKPRVTISAPTEEEVTERRRVIDFAKRHGFVPEGKRIEKMREFNPDRDLQISLLNGPHPNTNKQSPVETPTVPVPSQLRSPHPVVAALREDRDRLVMPAAMRRRALLLLQGLAAEAVRRGHQVKEHPVADYHRSHAYYSYNGQYIPSRYSRHEGEVTLDVGDFTYTVTIKKEFPQSEDAERASKLVIDLGYGRSDRRRQWGDRKRWKLEDVLGAVLQEVETRAVEDAQRKVDEERARTDRKVRWQEAMDRAKEKAVEAQLASALTEQARKWREATALRDYCEALEHRLAQAGEDEEEEAASAREWLTWAHGYIQRLDPLHRLPTKPPPQEPKPEELKPYLKGWGPHGPEAHDSPWGSY